jgi:hypothetical protein
MLEKIRATTHVDANISNDHIYFNISDPTFEELKGTLCLRNAIIFISQKNFKYLISCYSIHKKYLFAI